MGIDRSFGRKGYPLGKILLGSLEFSFSPEYLSGFQLAFVQGLLHTDDLPLSGQVGFPEMNGWSACIPLGRDYGPSGRGKEEFPDVEYHQLVVRGESSLVEHKVASVVAPDNTAMGGTGQAGMVLKPVGCGKDGEVIGGIFECFAGEVGKGPFGFVGAGGPYVVGGHKGVVGYKKGNSYRVRDCR